MGPRYGDEGGREDELLASAYRSCLEKVLELGARSIAFPVISAGIFGYPIEDATRIAIESSTPFADRLDIEFIAFDDGTLSHLKSALDASAQ